jgi:hypothetical protein
MDQENLDFRFRLKCAGGTYIYQVQKHHTSYFSEKGVPLEPDRRS